MNIIGIVAPSSRAMGRIFAGRHYELFTSQPRHFIAAITVCRHAHAPLLVITEQRYHTLRHV